MLSRTRILLSNSRSFHRHLSVSSESVGSTPKEKYSDEVKRLLGKEAGSSSGSGFKLSLSEWRSNVDSLLTSLLKTTLSTLPSSTLTSTLSSLSYVPKRESDDAHSQLSISQQIANEKIKEIQRKVVKERELREEDRQQLDQAVEEWKAAEEEKNR